MILVFDFDGTIHKTEIAYKKAITESLADLNLDVNDFDFKSFIGMGPKEVWDIILKDDSDKTPYIKKNGDRIIKYMEEEGELFPGAIETLAYLKNKYDLYILSKCRRVYMDAAREKFGLDRYFSKYFVGEDYNFLDKYKILRRELKEEYIMIGDRREDMEAGLKNGQKTIFATYGYGSLAESEGAYKNISSITELKNIL
ncbi:HAD family hydrolase [uncultured Anaerococcus sp.]|uniref:HAD family hydrolase n=1 Tax=uncultured Anaerococcus sp. TaxID=293428 RepID=UPI00288A6D76|nr:HAD family hydrolase [uncultured Anaerococcus sp.]